MPRFEFGFRTFFVTSLFIFTESLGHFVLVIYFVLFFILYLIVIRV